jgi:hypothetical protein
MTNKEVRLLLNIHDQKLQDLKNRGEIKSTKPNKKSTNGQNLIDYDRESVLEYHKKQIEYEKYRAETMLSAIPDYEWEDWMLTEKDKLYGYSKEQKKWFPFEEIILAKCMGKTGRLFITGKNKCGDNMFVQIYRRHFVKLKQLGWLNNYPNLFNEVEEIIEEYFKSTTVEERIQARIDRDKKSYQFINYLGYLMPSQIYQPISTRTIKKLKL